MSETKKTRNRILDHAQERFFADGYAAVTMDQLAAELGMSKKTLYKFFPSKEDLLRSVAERLMAAARLMVSRIIKSNLTFVEKIDRFATTIGRELARSGRTFPRDIDRFFPDLWKRIETFREERILYAFSIILDQGVREGYVRDDINRRVLFNVYVGAVNAVVNPEILLRESFSLQEAINGLLTIVWRGVLTEKGNRLMAEQERIRNTH